MIRDMISLSPPTIESESVNCRQRIPLRPVLPPLPSLHPGEPEHRQPVELAEQPRPSSDQPHHPSAGRPVQPPRGRDDGGGAVPHRGVQPPRPPTRPCSPPLPWACLSHQLAKPPARFFQHCRPSPPPKEI